MDDPDVDHELIALLRESLGISNKAQDVVSSNTGKDRISLLLRDLFIRYSLCYFKNQCYGSSQVLPRQMTDP